MDVMIEHLDGSRYKILVDDVDTYKEWEEKIVDREHVDWLDTGHDVSCDGTTHITLTLDIVVLSSLCLPLRTYHDITN